MRNTSEEIPSSQPHLLTNPVIIFPDQLKSSFILKITLLLKLCQIVGNATHSQISLEKYPIESVKNFNVSIRQKFMYSITA